ncbi:hypothetical protein Ctob_014689 [Chrysochromulina tobinii]|uniref:EF-hand domain-containing protein n=1 Tax=Chrysochromulina tobinii TaxID=1460289 RepID=A0A0M0JXC8_9EUKA|nr:hypothetical protein Ctob_014689 [Chrysochromulina tobinii]|eukprot:KOO31215.1 hypothetical protein Ctob_014689 [Chrysochromulina sp. CCMP291]
MSRSPRPDGEDAVELLKQKAEADRREKLHRKKELRAMSEMTMRDWTRFSEYDVAGDRQLDWEAFLAMVPERVRKVHSIEQLRAVFSAADVDQDGILSLAELDIKQWDSLAIEMGFGAVSREVFRALDANGTGFINFREIPDSSALDVHVPGDEASDSLLASLVRTWNDSIDLERADILNATGWVIRGRDFETIRAELRALLTASGGHVVDLIKIFDHDAGNEMVIDDVEFASAMRDKFGYKGPSHALSQLFAFLDTDHGGAIGFDELAWDSSQDGQLSRREFLLKIQNFFKEDDAQLWETDVKSVALDAFNEMDDGGDVQDRGSVDIQEMERWLRVPTGPKVIRLKRRKRHSTSPQGQSGNDVGAPRRSPLIRETVQGSIAAAVERAAQARLAEQERAQRWRVPRDTPVNGLPPLQRWEVSAASELPPLMTGGGGPLTFRSPAPRPRPGF